MPLPPEVSPAFAKELEVAVDAARKAAETILSFYNAQSAGVYEKGDGSPVTDADLAADRIIRQTISAAFPDDALMTEEGENDDARLANDRVWIVDPIDGTAQFVGRTDKFDVLIALAAGGKATVGVTLQPTTGLMHVAVAGEGAWRHDGTDWQRHLLSPAAEPLRIVASTYYLDPVMEKALGTIAGSLGSDLPPIMDVGFQPRALDDAERWYDVFIGFPQDPTVFAAREWDIAASDVIVHEAGGRLTDAWGRDHQYNKRDTHISGGLIASVSPELHDTVLRALAPHLPETPPSPDPADDK